jgi:D-lactate dehydrogenase
VSGNQSKSYDVFFFEAFEEETKELKRILPSSIKAGFSLNTIQENGNVEPPSSLISIRTQSRIPVDWANKLKGILSRSTGYDHLETYFQECKTPVHCGYLPLYCHRAVAEQAMLMWMALMRKLPLQLEQFSAFYRDGLTGHESENKVLLVVGVGNIGYEVVKIGRGLGMDVLGVDIEKKHDSVNYVEIDEGIVKADIIVCAMNLTSDNRNYFNCRLLRRAKPGVIFVNIARGEMSPSADLLRLLDEHHLGGVALDVYNQEDDLAVALRSSATTNNEEEVKAAIRLSEKPNAILTPHNAFNTQEAVERKVKQSVEQITHFIQHGVFLWPVPV